MPSVKIQITVPNATYARIAKFCEDEGFGTPNRPIIARGVTACVQLVLKYHFSEHRQTGRSSIAFINEAIFEKLEKESGFRERITEKKP